MSSPMKWSIYPLVICYSLLLKIAIEIVDLYTFYENGGSFQIEWTSPSSPYVSPRVRAMRQAHGRGSFMNKALLPNDESLDIEIVCHSQPLVRQSILLFAANDVYIYITVYTYMYHCYCIHISYHLITTHHQINKSKTIDALYIYDNVHIYMLMYIHLHIAQPHLKGGETTTQQQHMTQHKNS